MTDSSDPAPAPGGPSLTGVVGATGKTGRRVVARLRELGAPVRPLSRVTGFSWDDRGTWPEAVSGLTGVYVAHHVDYVVPGTGETVAAFARVASSAGVERLVLLTGRNEPEAAAAEAAVREEFAGATVVRSAWFAQNLTEGLMAAALASGELALPVGAVPEPFVDAGDVADVAVAALLDGRHAGASYEVTGPRSLTFAEIAEVVAPGTRYRELTLDDARTTWTEVGLPPEAVRLYVELFGTLFDGRNTEPADGVRRALGREASDVRQALTRG